MVEKRRRWSHKVKTVSTFPPAQLITKDADTIAKQPRAYRHC
jgi:hypothetical protein